MESQPSKWFLGKANFATIAVARAKPHTRALQKALAQTYRTTKDLFKLCPLTTLARGELAWWLELTLVA